MIGIPADLVNQLPVRLRLLRPALLIRIPTRFVQKYTLRLAQLELGGVDLDLAVRMTFFHPIGLTRRSRSDDLLVVILRVAKRLSVAKLPTQQERESMLRSGGVCKMPNARAHLGDSRQHHGRPHGS